MKRFFAVCAILAFITFPAFAASGYSSVIDDLPLMPGMVEKTDDAVVFDNPSGRIVETTAATEASAQEILNFYTDTLPPLGWQKSAAATFVRENETLKITTDGKGKTTVVHFSLTPHEGKQP